MSVISREVRGRLVAALNAARGLRVSLETLYAVVRDEQMPATPKSLKAELAYLESAGYVKRFGSDSWQIEAKGTDLCEGSIDPDPGVIMPAEERE
jgi:hypothetical protein